MEPVLLDASFLIDLEREIEAGQAGPAMAWLRANRSLPDRPLIVSGVSVAEFLEGFEDERRGLHFILRFVTQTLGFKQARRCAEVQRRARRRGRRFGENHRVFVNRTKCLMTKGITEDAKQCGTNFLDLAFTGGRRGSRERDSSVGHPSLLPLRPPVKCLREYAVGENDAWQIAFADCAGAAIVARDRRAFDQLGPRYEQYARS